MLSLLSSVPVTHQTPRGMEEIQNQEPETFQVECAVCLTDRLIFKKMHHSWSPETGHYVCLGRFRAWKRACTESRAEWPECEQLTCPLCDRVLLQKSLAVRSLLRVQSPLRLGIPFLRKQWPRGREPSRVRSLLALRHRGPRVPHLWIGRPSPRGR